MGRSLAVQTPSKLCSRPAPEPEHCRPCAGSWRTAMNDCAVSTSTIKITYIATMAARDLITAPGSSNFSCDRILNPVPLGRSATKRAISPGSRCPDGSSGSAEINEANLCVAVSPGKRAKLAASCHGSTFNPKLLHGKRSREDRKLLSLMLARVLAGDLPLDGARDEKSEPSRGIGWR